MAASVCGEGRRWTKNGAYDRCRHCGRTERPHEAKGYCRSCYSYHADVEKARRRRKRYRMKMSDEAYDKARARTLDWKKRNKARYEASKARWHEAHYLRKWAVGDVVTVDYAGFPCRGLVARYYKCAVTVVLDGGTVLKYGSRRLSCIKNHSYEIRAGKYKIG